MRQAFLSKGSVHANAEDKGQRRSIRRRFRLRSQAAILLARDEFCGSTLLTINTSSRCPSMTSPRFSRPRHRHTTRRYRSESCRDRARASARRSPHLGGAGSLPCATRPGQSDHDLAPGERKRRNAARGHKAVDQSRGSPLRKATSRKCISWRTPEKTILASGLLCRGGGRCLALVLFAP